MEKSRDAISIGFMLDAAIANASKARGLKSARGDFEELAEALEAVEDAFDAAAEACRRATTIAEQVSA